MYYVGRPPRSTSPEYNIVVNALDPDFMLGSNKTQQQPLVVRFGSGKQIFNLLWFLDLHKQTIWGIDVPQQVRFQCRVEQSKYYPVIF
jgi:hypothetical protein